MFALILGLACAIAIPYTLYSFYGKVNELDQGGNGDKVPNQNASGSSLLGLSGTAGQDKQRWQTIDDYARDHTEVVPGLPWTAPIHQDNLTITSNPDLFCVIWDRGGDEERCTCYNEQAIKQRSVPDPVCFIYAREGVYNPYRQKPAQAQGMASVDAIPVPIIETDPQ